MKGAELLKHLRLVACFKSGRDLAERLSHADRIQREQREALLLAVDEIERLRLADAEREAIETAAMIYEQGAKQMGHIEDGKRAVALRAMLERLG